ncbi:mitochondrial carrier, partial [Fusarium mundagurra]
MERDNEENLVLEQKKTQTEPDSGPEQIWRKLGLQGKEEADAESLREGLRLIDHPLGNADKRLIGLVQAMDRNGDGKIQYEEFKVFVQEAEQQLKLLFESIDRDRDGLLGRADLQAAFREAGLSVPTRWLTEFFNEADFNCDGYISLEEWLDFLLFMPAYDPSSPLRAVLTFYLAIVTLQPSHILYDAANDLRDVLLLPQADSPPRKLELTVIVPDPSYFIAGAFSGAASRTITAPLDRLQVHLLIDTRTQNTLLGNILKTGKFWRSLKRPCNPISEGIKDLYRIGGLRTFFVGNGLNVIKIGPETAVRFGCYELANRVLAHLEGHDNAREISPISKFFAGGIAGVTAQCSVYPIDTLKFRQASMQCETVQYGPCGRALLKRTLRTTHAKGGFHAWYRGLSLGLVGRFPYSAIDMVTYEMLKDAYKAHAARRLGVETDDVVPGNSATGVIGASSGSFAATAVYPLNVLRTRLQAEGTCLHPRLYTGLWDVTRRTFKTEGVRGFFKGLTPNLARFAPALSITMIT